MKKHMGILVVLQLLIVSSWVNLAWAEAGNIPIGGMDLVPSIKLGESYDDNFLSQETVRKSSWITVIEPSLALKAVSGANEYELNYRLTQGLYQNSHNDDYTNHSINFDSNLDLSRRLDVNMNVAYNKKADPRGSIFTGQALQFKTPDLFHETILGGSIDYGENKHVIASAEYSNKRYDNHTAVTAVRDLDTIKGSLKLTTPTSQRLSAVFEANYDVYKYRKIVVGNLDSRDQRYLLGLDWEATAKTSGEVRVGYLKKTFIQKALNTPSFFSWDLHATWEPLIYSSFIIGTSKDTQEAAGTADFIISTTFDASWHYSWSDYLSHNILLTYSNDAYKNKANPRLDKKTSVSVALDYQIIRWLSIEATYDYTNNKSDAAISSYKRNIWAVNFIGML